MKKLKLIIAGGLTLAGMSANAGLTRIVDNGNLLGANNVEVNGGLYDVRFLTGTCIDVFDGCDENADFIFQTQSDAIDATFVILNEIFLDTSDGNFDSSPELISGCSSNLGCSVLTSYSTNGITYQSIPGFNPPGTDSPPEIFIPATVPRQFDVSTLPFSTFAKWSEATVSEVSSPYAFHFLLIGFAGLLLNYKVRKL